MKDPMRILDEGATEAESRLLRSARLDVAPPHGKLRVLGALGLGATGASAAAAATATQAATPLAVLSKWVALGALAGAVTTSAVETVRFHVEDARAHGATSNAPVRHERELPAPRDERASAAPRAVATTAEPSDEAAATTEKVENPGPRAAARPLDAPASRAQNDDAFRLAAATEPPLSVEVKSIDDARRALSMHDAKGSLELLAAHDRAFPAPRLAPEATVLRIETLLALGRKSDAIRMGEHFLSADSASTYREHVQSLLREARRSP